ncbi:MAG TPA: aminotransferase class I/II-fold pyridoxal phosphate-dependent enzyme [Chloroflexota bacterium]|nr:aminotransferase class I/II-fold pyridoxal phosphate-dependent enzyme [Chloroflexota bacterium]
MTKRVLVTGGAGYLGSVLVPTLLDEGYDVDVFDRFLFGREPLAAVSEHPRLRLIEGDITRLAEHNGFLEGTDAVIHLAALSNDPTCDLRPEMTQRVNFEATTELARRCARAGVRRFIFASSCSVYGANPSPLVDELSELHPVSLYAQKKAEAERALLSLPAPGMTITALRMATLYGLSPRMRFDLAINLMVMNAVTRRAIYVLGGGRQWRPFLHVADATQAFLTTLQTHPEVVDRQTFNVGADRHNFQIQDLAVIVREALPQFDVAVTTVPDDADRRSYRVSFKKVAEQLRFQPRCDVKDSVVEIARAIHTGRLGDCSDTRYYTVKHLASLSERPAMAGGDPVRSQFLPFALPLIGREEEEEVLDSLRSGWMTTGPKTKRFEQLLCEYTGAKHAIAVNSCTAALHVSLAALGVGPGDEVITTAVTFPATANVVIHQGAKPVLVDVDPTTLNLDPEAVAAAVTPRTKAIIPVHMAGQPVDVEAIQAIARRHGLAVIEDAAHGIGAAYRGQKIGNLAGTLATCYSFYPIKNMTTIEGGAILTNDDAFAEQCRLYSLHGISKDAWKRYSNAGYQHWDTLLPGFKYNMTDVQAAVGLHQLPKLDDFIRTRERYANLYQEAFADLPELESLRRVPDVHHAWHLFVILLRLERLSIDRDGFMEALRRENIGTGIHFRSLHIQPLYRETFGYRPEDLPRAAAVSERLLSLPLYPKMTERDILDVVAAVRKLVTAYRRPVAGETQTGEAAAVTTG